MRGDALQRQHLDRTRAERVVPLRRHHDVAATDDAHFERHAHRTRRAVPGLVDCEDGVPPGALDEGVVDLVRLAGFCDERHLDFYVAHAHVLDGALEVQRVGEEGLDRLVGEGEHGRAGDEGDGGFGEVHGFDELVEERGVLEDVHGDGLDEGEEEVDVVWELFHAGGIGDVVPGVDPGVVGEGEPEPFGVVIVRSASLEFGLVFCFPFRGAIDSFQKGWGNLVVGHSWRRRNGLDDGHL